MQSHALSRRRLWSPPPASQSMSLNAKRWRWVQADEANREAIAPHVVKLIAFMRDRTGHSRDLEKPTDAAKAWSVSDDLWWCRTVDADRYVMRWRNSVSLAPAHSTIVAW
jgi:hypothetical protein